MLRSLITNNCHGVMIYKQLRSRYESPTIALQILPEEFWKFCGELERYLGAELAEYREPSDEHKRYLEHMFGYVPREYPLGLVDDVMVVFQHDKSFSEAEAKWNRRKSRVDFNSLAYMLHAKNETYGDSIQRFLDLGLPHSVVITEGFDYPGAYRFDVPEGKDCFCYGSNGKKLIEANFSIAEWLEL